MNDFVSSKFKEVTSDAKYFLKFKWTLMKIDWKQPFHDANMADWIISIIHSVIIQTLPIINSQFI